MGLTVACMTSYCSKSRDEVQWSDDAYGAAAFKNAIKGQSIKRGQYVLVRGKWLQVTDSNKVVALDWFVDMAHDFLAANQGFSPGGPGPNILIPLPGSKLVPGASIGQHSPHTLATKLAARLTQIGTPTQVADVLRWAQPMQNTHGEGGSRDPEQLYPHLLVTGPVPAGRRLLLDDVCTGGGHLRAAAYVLEKSNVLVEHALCAVKAEGAPTPQHNYFHPSVHEYPDFMPMAEFFKLLST
ncbi:phosphoribosyltransferase [Corallococcus exiguus]|uniref:phosphoribosyltransferase n=1 Tax=Corallococcus exiguus TaxID=83462 RepID=UPI0015611C11|nr:phosphoribosyltransferase [Corallococcus exiguus]NRD64766.1 phosphoribosyltransferase [Corallococcus exiguus]